MSEYNFKNFVHLHNHTEYSMLDSTAKYKNMIKKAKELEMKALAITDHGNMYGALKFYKECKKNNIKPIIGCEVYTTNYLDQQIREQYHLVLLAKNNIGYHNLIKIVSEASEHIYYKPLVNKEIIKKYSDGLICLSGCIGGEIAQNIIHENISNAENVAKEYINIFSKDDFYIEIQSHGLKDEIIANKGLVDLAKKLNISLVATNDIHYVEKEDWEAQDALLCLQTKTKISDTKRMRFETKEFYLKTQEEMMHIFKDYGKCLSNTMDIADKCNVLIEENLKLSPIFPNIPNGFTEETYLRKICEDQLPNKYTDDKISVARERLEYELGIINKMNYPGYFLIVWDFINYAKNNGISIGPGRGSGAGSIACFLTGITELDPLEYGLLFERFLNPERVSMPDIDTDISDKGRDLVVQYMIDTYKFEKSAQIVTYGTENPKGAIRDIVSIYQYPYDLGDRLSKLIPTDPHITIDDSLKQSAELNQLYETDDNIKKIINMAKKIEGLPRQSSTHAAGVVISEYPLKDILPVEKQEDGLHTQFDKDEVEALGLLKMDLLGLKNLSIIDDARILIKNKTGINIDFSKIPKNDTKTMEMLKNGDTFGVFQLESSGMTELVKNLSPDEFKDLIPLVALYRPGPLGSGMVNDFVECRHGRKEIVYKHPLLEPILKETFGVILYQEQVMQIVQSMAGFSLGKADLLRRAMGKKKEELLKQQRDGFVNGCKENNINEDISNEIFDLMMFFASYGFNKSHSAAYAFLAYQTAYLKANYPLEYMSAYISNNLDSPEKIYKSINICKRNNINLLTPSILFSDFIFKPEGTDIRFGLGAIKNLGEVVINNIIEERNNIPFNSIIDFLVRVNISESNFKNLCMLGVFSDLYKEQEKLCFCSSDIFKKVKEYKDLIKKSQKKEDENAINLFNSEELNEVLIDPPDIESIIGLKSNNIKPFSISEKLNTEKEILGFYATHQPLDYCKDTLAKCNSLEDILDNPMKYVNKFVNICGLKESLREISTRDGLLMGFLTINVYGKTIDCVVFPKVYITARDAGFFNNDIFLLKQAKVAIKDNKLQLIPSTVISKQLV